MNRDNQGHSTPPRLSDEVARLLGARRAELVPVAGNWGLTVYRAETEQGMAAVKAGRAVLDGHLETEARMLGDLARSGFPVPRILAEAPDILVTEWIEHDASPLRPVHERAAAEALAALHAAAQPSFGYPYPTQFGSLAQPNDETSSWTEFFRTHRLGHYASLAAKAGLIDSAFHLRLGRLGQDLGRFIDEPAHPSLLHGDVWTGNILTHGAELRAIVDPALFCGHPEYELAYVTLHGTFGRAFFEAYTAHAPISPEFVSTKRDIYLIVPLLQHTMLSGPVYLHQVDRTLRQLGIS